MQCGEVYTLVKLTVVDSDADVSVFDLIEGYCVNSFEYNNTSIGWINCADSSYAYFEYGDYEYYVELCHLQTENAIIDVVKSMF